MQFFETRAFLQHQIVMFRTIEQNPHAINQCKKYAQVTSLNFFKTRHKKIVYD